MGYFKTILISDPSGLIFSITFVKIKLNCEAEIYILFFYAFLPF